MTPARHEDHAWYGDGLLQCLRCISTCRLHFNDGWGVYFYRDPRWRDFHPVVPACKGQPMTPEPTKEKP